MVWDPGSQTVFILFDSPQLIFYSVGRIHWFGGKRREKARRPTMSLIQDRIQDDFRRQNYAAHKHNQRCNDHRDDSRGQCVCVCERAALWFCRLRPVCRLATGTSASETLDVRLRESRIGSDTAEWPTRLFGWFSIATLPDGCTRLCHCQLNGELRPVPRGRILKRCRS